MTDSPSPDSLRLLVAVAETGSISGAADELHVTQQAASRRLVALEQRLGLGLVDRTRRGSTLTAAGVVVASHAAEVLSALARLDDRVALLRDAAPGPIVIAASLTIAEHLVPDWLMRYRRDIGTVVTLRTGNSERVAELVRSGEAELGFVETTDRPADLRSEPLGDDELVLVVAPDHAWAGRSAPLELDRLATTALVTRERGSGTRRSFEDLLRAHGLAEHRAPEVELSTAAGVRTAIRTGVAPGVLSRLAVADDLRLGRLVVVPVSVPLTRPLSVLRRRGSAPSSAAAALVRIARSGTAGGTGLDHDPLESHG